MRVHLINYKFIRRAVNKVFLFYSKHMARCVEDRVEAEQRRKIEDGVEAEQRWK